MTLPTGPTPLTGAPHTALTAEQIADHYFPQDVGAEPDICDFARVCEALRQRNASLAVLVEAYEAFRPKANMWLCDQVGRVDCANAWIDFKKAFNFPHQAGQEMVAKVGRLERQVAAEQNAAVDLGTEREMFRMSMLKERDRAEKAEARIAALKGAYETASKVVEWTLPRVAELTAENARLAAAARTPGTVEVCLKCGDTAADGKFRAQSGKAAHVVPRTSRDEQCVYLDSCPIRANKEPT